MDKVIYIERNDDGTIRCLHDGGDNGLGGIMPNLKVEKSTYNDPEVIAFLNPPLQLDQKIANVQLDNNATLHALTASILAINNKEQIPDWALSILNDLNVKVQEVVTLDVQEKQTLITKTIV